MSATPPVDEAAPPPPPPPAVPCAPLDAAIARKLVKSGDRERIKRLLADRLEQCGWRDAVTSLAAAELSASAATAAPPLTVTRLAAALADRAREAVPDGVKAEFLVRLKGAVAR